MEILPVLQVLITQVNRKLPINLDWDTSFFSKYEKISPIDIREKKYTQHTVIRS